MYITYMHTIIEEKKILHQKKDRDCFLENFLYDDFEYD